MYFVLTFFVLVGSAWTQDVVPDVEREGRFGFGIFEPLRKMFCESTCKSNETMLYLMDLTCLVKCPELFIQHHQQETTLPAVPTSSPKPLTINTQNGTGSSSPNPSAQSASSQPANLTNPPQLNPSSSQPSSSTNPPQLNPSSSQPSSSTNAPQLTPSNSQSSTTSASISG